MNQAIEVHTKMNAMARILLNMLLSYIRKVLFTIEYFTKNQSGAPAELARYVQRYNRIVGLVGIQVRARWRSAPVGTR
jgi:hypothetical protein